MMLHQQEMEAIIDRLETLVDARDEFFNRFDLPRDHPLWGVSDWQLGAVVDFLLTPETVEEPK